MNTGTISLPEKISYTVLRRLPSIEELRKKLFKASQELKQKKKEMSVGFRELAEYWAEKLEPNSFCPEDGSLYYEDYLVSIVNTLSEVCNNEDELFEGARQLIDLTYGVYEEKNGSHQYICEAVPSLVKSGLVKTKDELIRGAEIIVSLPKPKERGEHIFSEIAYDITTERFKSLDELVGYRG